MNIKWMSLVAVMTVVSVGCSDSEQEPVNNTASDTTIQVETVEEAVKAVDDKPAVKTVEQKEAMIKEVLKEVDGIPPEKLDSEVQKLVTKISENSDMSKEEVTKLEQELKTIFQKLEAERTSNEEGA